MPQTFWTFGNSLFGIDGITEPQKRRSSAAAARLFTATAKYIKHEDVTSSYAFAKRGTKH